MRGHYKINIIMDSKRPCPEKETLRKVAQRALELEGVKDSVSVNLFFTDNRMIRMLNAKFLNKNTPTDVISFGAKADRGIGRHLDGFIGEIAISVEEAECNARRFDTSCEKEIFLYIVHGILHLLGYKDGTKSQIKIMTGRQDEILGTLCAS